MDPLSGPVMGHLTRNPPSSDSHRQLVLKGRSHLWSAALLVLSGIEANGRLQAWHCSVPEPIRISVAGVRTWPQCGQVQVGFGKSSLVRLRRAMIQAARIFLSVLAAFFLSATQRCSSAQESQTALLH
jgi:hypothetical protein